MFMGVIKFFYCPLIWMFHNWTADETNKINKRALKLVKIESRNVAFDEGFFSKR